MITNLFLSILVVSVDLPSPPIPSASAQGFLDKVLKISDPQSPRFKIWDAKERENKKKLVTILKQNETNATYGLKLFHDQLTKNCADLLQGNMGFSLNDVQGCKEIVDGTMPAYYQLASSPDNLKIAYQLLIQVNAAQTVEEAKKIIESAVGKFSPLADGSSNNGPSKNDETGPPIQMPKPRK